MGDTYHFDLFHTERKGSRSSLYIETKGIQFVQNSTIEDPPIDYFAYVNEDIHVDGIVTEMALTDVYSAGPNWHVSVDKGNYIVNRSNLRVVFQCLTILFLIR